MFQNRDVSNDAFTQVLDTIQVVPMPKNSPENHKITCMRLTDTNAEKYVYLDVNRMVLTMMDVRFSIADKNELIDGEIGVVDMTGFGWKHLWKAIQNMSIAKVYMKYIQEAAPFKIVKNHFVNCSPMTARFVSFMKPMMKKEVFDTISFHTTLDSLHKEVPKEYLPKEFGGSCGSMEEHHDEWKKALSSKR